MDNMPTFDKTYEICKEKKMTLSFGSIRKQLRWSDKLEKIRYFEVIPGERGKYFKVEPKGTYINLNINTTIQFCIK